MRRGFTMIELIFVIVIIGILAAVAVPKLQGVSEDAEIAKIQAYAGSLTRTTLPGIWSRSLVDGNAGAVDSYDSQIQRDMPAPDGLTVNGFAAGNLEAAGFNFVGTSPDTPTGAIVATETINGTNYDVHCSQGDTTHQPVCDVYNGSIWLLGSKQQ